MPRRALQYMIENGDPMQMEYFMEQSKDRISGDVEVAEIVLSNKGGPKLIHNGYMYTLHKKQTNNIRWRCVFRTSQCRGSLITSLDYKTPNVRMDHNHNPDYEAAKLARKRYVAMGQPPVFPEDPVSYSSADIVQPEVRIKKEENYEETANERPEVADSNGKRKLQKVMQSGVQGTSGARTIRVATHSLVRPQMRNIAPAPMGQQQPRQPKTLVLKTIPLKVKQVAPTTIKMAPRQPNVNVPQTVVAPQQSTEVCLRWNSYHSNMQNSFPSLLDTEQFVDVTLACEGRSLKCHKMILSSCSDYLAALLRENPCQHPIILMKDLKFWEVEALVKFMYRGEVNVAHDKLPQLLNAAEALQVKGLAGPSPSLQNPRPPKLVPQSKPLIPSSVAPSARIATEAKDSGKPTAAASSGAAAALPINSPKRVQKRQSSEPPQPRPFTKIRLQRPVTPVSPNPTVKLEPLDIPLSPTEIFPDHHDEDSSTASNFDNLVMALHEDEDRGSDDGDMNFCDVPGPPDDLNDADDHMEFVPTDFLEQEQDIVEEVDGDCSKSDDEMDEDEEEDDDEHEEIEERRKPPDNRKLINNTDDRGGGNNRKTEKCTNSEKSL